MRKRNQEIDERIMDDILVDCNGDEEMIMSWFYYIQDEMEFPYEAEIKIKKLNRKEVYKRIKVIDLSSESTNNLSIEVEVEFDSYIIEVPLEKIEKAISSEKNSQIINDWKYWKNT